MQTKASCASFVSSRFILFWLCAEGGMIGSFVAHSKCVAAVAFRFRLFRPAELCHRGRASYRRPAIREGRCIGLGSRPWHLPKGEPERADEWRTTFGRI